MSTPKTMEAARKALDFIANPSPMLLRAVAAAIAQAEEPLIALLVDCNQIALERGDARGLCDAIDNTDEPYPSQFLADTLARAIKPPAGEYPQEEP